MREFMLLSISAALINNLVLAQFLGIGAALTTSKNVKSATLFGFAITFVMICASAVTWGISTVLGYLNAEFLQTVTFIFAIVAIVQFLEMLSKRFLPTVNKIFASHLRLLTANCAILGIAIINVRQFGIPGPSDGGFAHAMIQAAFAGVGFLIAVVLLAGIRERLELQNVPKAFAGVPIALISAAFIAMAFLGFAG